MVLGRYIEFKITREEEIHIKEIINDRYKKNLARFTYPQIFLLNGSIEKTPTDITELKLILSKEDTKYIGGYSNLEELAMKWQ